MPFAPIRPLSTLDWIALRDADLRRRGYDPSHRVWYTGHKFAMRWQWLASVGRWAGHETEELIDKLEPHRARVHVTYAAYRKFKGRHGLMTRRQFQAHYGDHPWARAETCLAEYLRARQELGLHDVEPALGSACAYALATARTELGMLPVEAVIWSRSLSELLLSYGVDPDEWWSLDSDTKASAWGTVGAVDFDRVLRAPAVLHLPCGRLEADE